MCRSTVFSSEEAPPDRAMSSRALRHVGTTCRRWGGETGVRGKITLFIVRGGVEWTTTPSSPDCNPGGTIRPRAAGSCRFPHNHSHQWPEKFPRAEKPEGFPEPRAKQPVVRGLLGAVVPHRGC